MSAAALVRTERRRAAKHLCVRVHYPLAAGEALRLRAEPDWERDLVPLRDDPSCAEFELDFPAGTAPFRPFKPVLLRDGQTLWAQGANRLALRERAGPLDVHPFFAPDASCHVCDEHAIPSSFEARGHDLRVFLPPGYDENALQRFPVVYMQDGQNLFFPEQAPQGKHWRVAETLGVLDSMCLIRAAIVVGVYPRDRMQEYTHPGYGTYARFLAEELKPWVDRHYRTLPGAPDTAIMGSSLGGVVSLHAAWTYPHVFGLVGAMSSTFGYRDDLLERVLGEPKRALRVYLDSGWPKDNYEATRNLAAALRARGWRDGHELLALAFPDGRHEEQSWAMRVHLPFQFFFGESAPEAPRRTVRARAPAVSSTP